MTYEEALKLVKGCGFNIEAPLHNEVEDLVLSALERQIPKKPLPEEKIYGNGICPSCGAYFLDKSTKYCGNCGQALDWEKAE